MSYKECSSNIMEKTMKEYEDHKLKQRDGKIIKNHSQAIAIGLSLVQKNCKYTKEEMMKLITHVDEFLEKKGKVKLTNVIQTKTVINYYLKKKNYKKSFNYLAMLIERVHKSKLGSDDTSKHIINEMKNIL